MAKCYTVSRPYRGPKCKLRSSYSSAAKMIGLRVAKKEATQEESLDEARKKLVFAMKKGLSLVVSMQQASPPFSAWLDNEEFFPATQVCSTTHHSMPQPDLP